MREAQEQKRNDSEGDDKRPTFEHLEHLQALEDADGDDQDDHRGGQNVFVDRGVHSEAAEDKGRQDVEIETDRDDIGQDQREIGGPLEGFDSLPRMAGQHRLGFPNVETDHAADRDGQSAGAFPAMATTDMDPTAPARIGTITRNPLPKMDASGVMVALTSGLEIRVMVQSSWGIQNEN